MENTTGNMKEFNQQKHDLIWNKVLELVALLAAGGMVGGFMALGQFADAKELALIVIGGLLTYGINKRPNGTK